LIALMALCLGGGGLALWSRIFRPTFLLAEAATSFGGGNLQARAPILRNDEMGALNQTFNNMADAVCNREQERRDFIAVVAHDIRTPLSNVCMAAQLLNKMEVSTEQKVLLIERLTKNAGRMLAMVDDLLDCTQAEWGQLMLSQQKFDLAKLVREVVAEHSSVCQTHYFRLQSEDTCDVWGDKQRLERVVLNLLSNAVKYSSPGQNIVVKLEADGSYGAITIQDHGVGIAKQDLDEIFLPFLRLEKTRSMAPGSGIGLTSVKKIVEAHRGRIEIASQPGIGTTVKVTLPLNEANGQVKSANRESDIC
jgi:signal transduction histidine kinase